MICIYCFFILTNLIFTYCLRQSCIDMLRIVLQSKFEILYCLFEFSFLLMNLTSHVECLSWIYLLSHWVICNICTISYTIHLTFDDLVDLIHCFIKSSFFYQLWTLNSLISTWALVIYSLSHSLTAIVSNQILASIILVFCLWHIVWNFILSLIITNFSFIILI